MAQKIIIKNSSVGGKLPSTSDIDLGELAVNTFDGKLYIKKNDGAESIVTIGDSTGEIGDLQNQINLLDGRVTDNEGDIAINIGNIATNTSDIAQLRTDVDANDGDIATLFTRTTDNANDITALQVDVLANENAITLLENNKVDKTTTLNSSDPELVTFVETDLQNNITLAFNNLNGANGMVKLNEFGIVPSANLPAASTNLKGSYDASGDILPDETNLERGDYYIIAVGGTLNLSLSEGAAPSPVVVEPADRILYTGTPNEWIYIAGSSTTIAAGVKFDGAGNTYVNGATVQVALDQTDNKLVDHDTRINQNAGSITGISSAINQINQEQDDQDAQLADHDTRINQNAGSITGLTSAVDAINNEQDVQDAQLADHETRIFDNEGSITGLTTAVNQINQEQDDQDAQLADHETRITNNRGSITGLTSAVSAINNEQDIQDGRLDNLETVEILSTDPALITVLNPTLLNDVTISFPNVNEANGIAKIGPDGFLPIGIMPGVQKALIGSWSASSNQLPPDAALRGEYYVIEEAGTLNLARADDGVLAPIAVQPGDEITYTGRTGDWFFSKGRSATTASSVTSDASEFVNGQLFGTDVQSNLVEIDAKLVASEGNKADKVIGATPDNFASLSADGNLLDSSFSASSFATATQGLTADSALQPGDNISLLINDVNYLTNTDLIDGGVY